MDHALADTKFQVSTSEYLDGRELGSSEYLVASVSASEYLIGG